MKLAIAVLPNGLVNTHLGRANKVAVVTADNKEIVGWEEFDVPFGQLHGGHGHQHHHDHHDHNHDHSHGHPAGHHEAIRDFMVEHNVDAVLAEHSGPGIVHLLGESNIKLVVVDVSGTAKEVVQRYINQI